MVYNYSFSAIHSVVLLFFCFNLLIFLVHRCRLFILIFSALHSSPRLLFRPPIMLLNSSFSVAIIFTVFIFRAVAFFLVPPRNTVSQLPFFYMWVCRFICGSKDAFYDAVLLWIVAQDAYFAQYFAILSLGSRLAWSAFSTTLFLFFWICFEVSTSFSYLHISFFITYFFFGIILDQWFF